MSAPARRPRRASAAALRGARPRSAHVELLLRYRPGSYRRVVLRPPGEDDAPRVAHRIERAPYRRVRAGGLHRIVERIGCVDRLAFSPAAFIGIDAVYEAVMALIGILIRIDAALEERDVHLAVMDIIAILAVIHRRDAVACLREVGPLVGTGLELGYIPACSDLLSSLSHIAVSLRMELLLTQDA